ncbi:hypothetical protein ACLB2K_052695 [Fragaria x ananassa]
MQKKYNGMPTKPRLSVFCSDKQLYAMLVDDQNNKCLFYGSTLHKSIRQDPNCSTAEAAKRVGEKLIQVCSDLNIGEISSYDRNGFATRERIQAFEIAISKYGPLWIHITLRCDVEVLELQLRLHKSDRVRRASTYASDAERTGQSSSLLGGIPLLEMNQMMHLLVDYSNNDTAALLKIFPMSSLWPVFSNAKSREPVKLQTFFVSMSSFRLIGCLALPDHSGLLTEPD